MDVMEKLVELLRDVQYLGGLEEKIADHLLANSVTVQEWVSVEDRLPEESGMYIVTANDGHAQRVSFVLWQKKNRMWNLTGARSYWRVTHWTPLPPAPEDMK